MEPRRAESFSDGVFAVAITVLVFNLLPIAKKDIALHDLARAWPEYAGYVISFLTIGIMWLNHHTLLSHAARVDRTTLVLNLFLLMGVVAVPFTTALVADNLAVGTSTRSARLAAEVYGLLMIVISVCFQAMWLYLASHRAALAERPDRPQPPQPPEWPGRPQPPERPARLPLLATLRFGAGLAGYIAAVVVAAVASAQAALVMYGLIAVYYLFEHLPGPAETPGQTLLAGRDSPT